VFRLTLTQLAAKKLRLVSTAMAVFLGVTFLAGTLVLTDTVTATFDDILADAHAGTDAYVRGESPLDLGIGEQRPRIDDEVADTVRQVDGVRAVAVDITGYAQVVGDDGEPIGDARDVPMFGRNWIDVPELNPYRVSEGRAPAAADEIVVDEHTAARGDFVPGDRATVLTRGEPRTFTIVGLVTFGDATSAGGATSVLFTTATAQTLLGEPGAVDGISVLSADGVGEDEFVARIDEVTGSGVEVITGAALTEEEQDAIHEDVRTFAVFMLVFAGVAMFVGGFIINNTFSITVAQRTRELALLRTIGASGRQVRRVVLAEAAVVGVIASVSGLVAGIGAAALLKSLLASAGIDIPDGPPWSRPAPSSRRSPSGWSSRSSPRSFPPGVRRRCRPSRRCATWRSSARARSARASCSAPPCRPSASRRCCAVCPAASRHSSVSVRSWCSSASRRSVRCWRVPSPRSSAHRWRGCAAPPARSHARTPCGTRTAPRRRRRR
jgi:putative ABC transport system permease protein